MAAPQFPPPPPPSTAVVLPAQPIDPNVLLPAAPVFPPTVNDVLTAVRCRRDVQLSVAQRPPPVRCTPNDHADSIVYEHAVVAQAAAAAAPQAVAPPWIVPLLQQLCVDIRNDMRSMMRAEILPGLRQLVNQGRGDGGVLQFVAVPFTNGDDPTQPPHNLPPLLSVNAIQNLAGPDVVRYLQGYGVVPLPVGPNPHATNRLRKETLKGVVGATF